MTKYNKVTPAIVEELKTIVGPKNVTVDPDKLEIYSQDEVAEKKYHHLPEVVVFAESTEQVAEVVKLANRELIPVTPRGAGTGLACGCVPIYGGIVLSLEKMNKILEVNVENMYMVVQAGVLTSDVQKAAKEVGLFYAGDPSSGDSCFIGGNVATNAGGNKAVKYGTTRDQVYAIEVVTPQGKVTTLGGRLNKNTTGYCLDKLLIGSEGTLGIITTITLKLKPLASEVMDFLAVYPDVESAIDTVGKLLKAGITPTCVEFMDNRAVQMCSRYLNEKLPHQENGNYLIIQIETDTEDEMDNKAVQVDEICSEAGAMAVLVADSNLIWRARKQYGEAARHESLVHSSEDIVVPIDKLPAAMNEMVRVSEKYNATCRIASHAGDGNIHLEVLQGDIPDDEWTEKLHQIHTDIFAYVYKELGGKMSGEHGIGLKKKPYMHMYADPVELEMMQAIKKALDPNNIMNPGKIFDIA